MKKLFIVIVTYNPGADFIDLIKSLLQEKMQDYQIEIVIVDNKSKKNSEFRIQNSEFKIGIIKNEKNLGFAAGCNVGIKYAQNHGADAVLLLNQDVVIEKGFLNPLADNPADIVAPIIKFKRDNKWIYDYGGKINWWWGKTRHVEKSSKFNPSADGQSSKRIGEIDYISGCCMLIKRKVFEKVGYFDKRYFLYFEDVDFCLRAGRAGLTLAVEPKSVIRHNLIEGRKKSLGQKLHLIRSNFIFIKQYLGWRIPLGCLHLLVLTGKIVINRLLR